MIDIKLTELTELTEDVLALRESQRAALMEWMGGQLKKEAGGGIRIDKKFGGTSVKFRVGYNGSLKLKTVGVAMGLSLAGSEALSLSGHGQEGLGLWSLVAASMFFSSLGPALEGCKGAWSHAREEGVGRLASFGRMCQRAACGLKAKTVPNLWLAGVLVAAGVGLATEAASAAVSARAPGSRLDDLLGRAALGVGEASKWVMNGYERFGAWKFAQEVEGARLEGASHVGEDVYAMLGKGWMTQRFLRAEANPENSQILTKWMDENLSGEEKELRSNYANLIDSAPKDSEEMLKQIRLAEAAGVPPWFKPEPHMPSMLDLVESFQVWREKMEGRDEELSHKVAGWAARVEAWELSAVVGEARLARDGEGSPKLGKRVRL